MYPQHKVHEIYRLFYIKLYEMMVMYTKLHRIGEEQLGKGNGRATPEQAWTTPEGSRRLRLPDFKTIGM